MDRIAKKEINIIEKESIVLNSIDRMDPNLVELYTNLQIYLNSFVSSSIGINMYSFSLNPLIYQPSGCLNFSNRL